MPNPDYVRDQVDGVLLSVKLQPRASADEIGELLGGELRIKVTAPRWMRPPTRRSSVCSPAFWIADATGSNWFAVGHRGIS
jgi:hypothetical protein